MPQSMPTEYLIIFARYPEIGKVKTRLIPDLGAESATDIYKEMAESTIEQARALRLLRKISIQVWFTGGTEAGMQTWLGNDLNYQIQVGKNLGDRLIHSLKTTIKTENSSVIIIGTDCPDLDAEILNQGFIQLQHHDLVLGGATDGGYYLIGLQKFLPELFINIPWSSSEVSIETLNIAKEMGISYFLLPTLSDVDTAEDLEVWEKVKAINFLATKASNQKISIIIPTLNEAENLGSTLQAITNTENIEIIVVDGGSSDQTLAIAKSLGAKIILGATGRANQMNLGASQATGGILLFLHADTILPPKFAQGIRAILEKPLEKPIVAGAFKLKIDGKGWGLRLVEWGVNVRSQLFQMPYGDQAIFIKSEQFYKLGGFSDLPIMEDFELTLRLKAQGKIAIASLSVITSARRWQKLGVIRTTLINQIMIVRYFLSINYIKLAQWYRKTKE